MGRHTEFNQDIADAICNALANGSSLRAVCRQEDMPVQSTVFKWLAEQELFSKQYACAREEQAETLADEIVSIADEASSPLIVDGVPLLKENGQPVMVTDAVSVNHARLKMDARKWVASKLKPKKFGDKLDIDASHSGEVVIKMQSSDNDL
jgi:hypothetical protein